MITDPGTTPAKPRNQVVFGVTAAAVYGLLVCFHVVFGLFFALVITCALRGAVLLAVPLLTGGDTTGRGPVASPRPRNGTADPG